VWAKLEKQQSQSCRIADNGKNKILISIISMVEILYLSERNTQDPRLTSFW